MNKKISEVLGEIHDLISSVEYRFDELYIDEVEDDYREGKSSLQASEKVAEELSDYFYYEIEGGK